MYVFCFCFGSQNRSSNLHCCHGGGVDDPEIFMGIEDERLPKSSKKNNIMMYSFVMSWNWQSIHSLSYFLSFFLQNWASELKAWYSENANQIEKDGQLVSGKASSWRCIKFSCAYYTAVYPWRRAFLPCSVIVHLCFVWA